MKTIKEYDEYCRAEVRNIIVHSGQLKGLGRDYCKETPLVPWVTKEKEK